MRKRATRVTARRLLCATLRVDAASAIRRHALADYAVYACCERARMRGAAR